MAEIIFTPCRWSQRNTVFQSASQLFGKTNGKGYLGQWAFRTKEAQALKFISSFRLRPVLLVRLYFRFSSTPSASHARLDYQPGKDPQGHFVAI